MRKLLILEAAWRKHPTSAPTETRSASALYVAAVQGPTLQVERHALRADTLVQRVNTFVGYPENRRGLNVIVLSAHGHYDALSGRRTLAMDDGAAEFYPLLAAIGPHLRRSLVMLDACQIGQQPQHLRQALALLGVVGFAREVSWTASGVLMHALLRRWMEAGVFHLRRASPIRAKRVVESFFHNEYKMLSQRLALTYAFP